MCARNIRKEPEPIRIKGAPCSFQKKMKNSELKEYVNSFPDDAPVSIICANPRKRKLYKLENVIWVTDQGQPLILIDIGNESDMDAEMNTAEEKIGKKEA